MSPSTPTPVPQNTDPNSCLATQYVIPVDDEQCELAHLNEVFFFYQQGVKDAIRSMMSTYQHTPEPLEDHTGSTYSNVLNDLDQWMEHALQTNTAPKHDNIQDVYENTQFACEFLDVYLYQVFTKYFKDLGFEVMSVTDIVPQNQDQYVFLIKVQFNPIR